MAEKADRELSLMVKEMVEGTTEELKTMLPQIDLAPDVSDQKIKQAILGLSPAGMEQLFRQFGQAEVTKFISEFARNKRW